MILAATLMTDKLARENIVLQEQIDSILGLHSDKSFWFCHTHRLWRFIAALLQRALLHHSALYHKITNVIMNKRILLIY